MEKNIFLSISLIFAMLSAHAQLGFHAGYMNFNLTGWNEFLQDDFNEAPYPLGGWQVGMDYWFRLKKRRIEFSPSIAFSKFSSELDQGKLTHTEIGLHFNTAFYVFDLASDCNCPTFSKDGNFFSKGFFVELSPGVIRLENDASLSTGSGFFNREGDEIAFGGSVGAGLDLGISDLFTITPLVRFHYYPNIDWTYRLQPAGFQENLHQLFLGVRLRLHFKEMAKARYR